MRWYSRPPDAWYRWFAWHPAYIEPLNCHVWWEWLERRPLWCGYEYRFPLDDEARR